MTGPSAELSSGVMKGWVRLANPLHALKLCILSLGEGFGCCCLDLWQLRKPPWMCSGL